MAYKPAEDVFCVCTGDGDRPEGYECHWLRGAHDPEGDEWCWAVIVSDRLNSRYKAGAVSFVDGNLYSISDSNGREPYDRGNLPVRPG